MERARDRTGDRRLANRRRRRRRSTTTDYADPAFPLAKRDLVPRVRRIAVRRGRRGLDASWLGSDQRGFPAWEGLLARFFGLTPSLDRDHEPSLRGIAARVRSRAGHSRPADRQ